jgi:hypothetical protein
MVSETDLPWQTDIFAILPHTAKPSILMLSGEKGCFLPGFRLNDQGLWVQAGLVKQELQKKLGLEVNVLRRAYYRADVDIHRAESIYILEGHPPLVDFHPPS